MYTFLNFSDERSLLADRRISSLFLTVSNLTEVSGTAVKDSIILIFAFYIYPSCLIKPRGNPQFIAYFLDKSIVVIRFRESSYANILLFCFPFLVFFGYKFLSLGFLSCFPYGNIEWLVEESVWLRQRRKFCDERSIRRVFIAGHPFRISGLQFLSPQTQLFLS